MTEIVSTESTNDSRFPSMAIDSEGNVHIAWNELTDYLSSGTDRDIFYKRWVASSSTWTTTEVVSTESTENSRLPSMAIDSEGNVHIAWNELTDYLSSGTDRDIFYKRWVASSSTWTTTEVVSTESTADSTYPSLAVDSTGTVHIAWEDWTDYAGAGTDEDIFYKNWSASTSSWITTEVVSTESTSRSSFPSLTVDSTGTIHIAWDDNTVYAGAGADRDIFYKQWKAFSSSWTTTEVVSTESTDYSLSAFLVIDSAGNFHIAWYDKTDYAGAGTDEDIFYKRWDAVSSSWITTKVVSTESDSYSRSPSLIVDSSGNIHIAWHDGTDYVSSGTDSDVFYKRWDTSTSTWTTTEVVSTESTGDSTNPSLTVNSTGTIHIAWQDITDYNGAGTDIDIFYKFLTGPPLAPELAFIVPNPTDIDTVYLDWDNVTTATTYYVYRSAYYIWSVEKLNPIATVITSGYFDTIPYEGNFYYVIVAGNFAGNSSHSNCQYVEVIFPDFKAPELTPILPNPTEVNSISLVWDSIDGATEYYIYRSDSYIWSVEGLTPVDTVITTSFVDTLPSEGYYFYVIVASDGVRNSSHSNCEYIEYKLPTLNEYAIISGIILGAFVVLFAITRTRKKNSKLN